ncbi:zinc-binding metallopeptidase family protein [Spirosoma pollinicola]|uniref:Uncharacterized protein n=1 Tax=Spirosoma pollinicola TaxID=2057025 RepID=A0A2K8Z613_9BACT|nr:hypothetical protein [Spirosoma pollinicola]AUD05315.1 hypothetical protein CWM47_27780 [Spirosoma pollinicola]
MKKNHKIIGLLVCVLVTIAGQPIAWGQTDSSGSAPDYSQYMPIVDVPLIGKPTVTFPGQAPIKVSKDDLGDVIGNYVENLSNQLSPDNVLSSIGSDLTGYFASMKDELSDEVSGLIGEAEDQIMSGISDKIAQLASTIADVGTTPAGEVERLKKMVAEGYTSQQKITYQTLKVDYAWKKSHTTLSPEFCSYYKELNIKGLFDAVKFHVRELDKILSSPVFTDKERQGYQSLIKSVGATNDLASSVNIVCNLGSSGQGVTVSWMAQGERMDVLDQAATAIKKRLEDVGSLRDELRRIYVYRIAKQQANEFKQGSFQKKSGLNHVDTN